MIERLSLAVALIGALGAPAVGQTCGRRPASSYVGLDYVRSTDCGFASGKAEVENRHRSCAIRVNMTFNNHGTWQRDVVNLEPGEARRRYCAETRVKGARFLP